jgi:hypothetical protein
VALFVIAFVGIFAGAIYAVNWVADNSWFVGTEGNQVAIFRGRPGGLLWREPRVEKHAGFTLDEVLTQFRASVQAGHEATSLADAQAYADLAHAPPTTTTTTTTTTSVPDGLNAFEPNATTTTLATGP